jgi:hypothetical protein
MSALIVLLSTAWAEATGPQVGMKDADIVECPFSVSSTWKLVSFEEDGNKETRRGQLKIGPKGKGILHIFPYAPWMILATRITGEGASGTVELDINWEGECPGRATLRGLFTVRDNQLWFCFDDKRRPRPTCFSTTPGDGRTLLLLKRTK